MDRKEEISDNLYYFLLVLWGVIKTLTRTTVFSNIEILNLKLVYRIICLVIYGFLFIRALFYVRKYTFKQFFILLCLAVIVIITYSYTHSDVLGPAYFFVASSYNINLTSALKKIWIMQIVVTIFIIFFAAMGIIPNEVIYRYSKQRRSMGFTHPNTLGSILLSISLLSFYLFHKDKQKRVYIISIICYLIAHYVADSRTASTLILVVLLAQITESVICNKKNTSKYIKHIKFFIQHMLEHSGLFFLLIIILNFLAILESSKLASLNLPLTFKIRYYYAFNYLKYYSVNLFGQPIYLHGDKAIKRMEVKYGLGTLDNAYASLLLKLGIIGSIIFIGAYYARIKMGEKKRDYVLLIILLIYAVYGSMENGLISLDGNYFILLFADLIWNKRILTRKQSC